VLGRAAAAYQVRVPAAGRAETEPEDWWAATRIARWHHGATAAWTGLNLAYDREDLMRAALDGVATLLRQRLDDLRDAGHHPAQAILGGAGTTHRAWRTLLEETLALPLTPAPTTWLTPAGAALLAATTA
jgi:sugar (pentulose or hexulose) kinase